MTEILETFPRLFCFRKLRINENGGKGTFVFMLPADPAPKVDTSKTLKSFDQKVERKTVEDKMYEEKRERRRRCNNINRANLVEGNRMKLMYNHDALLENS